MKVVHNRNENVLCLLIPIQVRSSIDDIPSNSIENGLEFLHYFKSIITVVGVGAAADSLERI